MHNIRLGEIKTYPSYPICSAVVDSIPIFVGVNHCSHSIVCFQPLVPMAKLCLDSKDGLNWPHRFAQRGNPTSIFSDGRSSQMLHVWNIYLQNWVILGVNVGKYSIDGAFGHCETILPFFDDGIVFGVCPKDSGCLN